MPTAIIVSDTTVPAILDSESLGTILRTLTETHGAPPLSSVAEAAQWLATCPYPSGWYQNRADAVARLQRDLITPPMTADEFAAIRNELGLSRAVFASSLGFGGSANTRHKQIWEMEKARKPILPERARAARAMLALYRLQAVSS